MTTPPVAKTTVVADTLANLFVQFQGAPILNAIVASHAVQLQEIETMFVSLIVDMALPNAIGEQLDLIGRIVGEGRKGRSDDDYRVALGARIIINRSNGSVEDIIAVLKAAEDLTYEVTDLGYASLLVRIVGAIGSVSTAEIDTVLQEVRGAGIRADLIYSEEDDADTFQFASGDVEEADADAGWANDAGTVGGSFAEVE
jgi:hypothetical protein